LGQGDTQLNPIHHFYFHGMFMNADSATKPCRHLVGGIKVLCDGAKVYALTECCTVSSVTGEKSIVNQNSLINK